MSKAKKDMGAGALTFAQIVAMKLDADGGGMREQLADALIGRAADGDLKALALVLDMSGDNRREARRLGKEARIQEEKDKAEHLEELRKKEKEGTLNLNEQIELWAV